jgi:hypothetical protein
MVLSDGLDYYIQRVLLRHGLDLPVLANHLEFAPPDRIAVSFPYFEHSCGKCGNCKVIMFVVLPNQMKNRLYWRRLL